MSCKLIMQKQSAESSYTLAFTASCSWSCTHCRFYWQISSSFTSIKPIARPSKFKTYKVWNSSSATCLFSVNKRVAGRTFHRFPRWDDLPTVKNDGGKNSPRTENLTLCADYVTPKDQLRFLPEIHSDTQCDEFTVFFVLFFLYSCFCSLTLKLGKKFLSFS